MNPPDPADHSPEERSTLHRLRQVRPAAANAAFRQRLLVGGPPDGQVLPFSQPTATKRKPSLRRILFGIAAAAALVALGVFLLQPPVSKQTPELATSEKTVAQPELTAQAVSTLTLPVQTREIALLRRGLEPPVQLLAVEEVEISAEGSPSVQPHVTTRIVPVVLQYY